MTLVVRSNSSKKVTRSVKSGKAIISDDPVEIAKTELYAKTVNSKIGSNMDMTRFRFHQTPTPAPDGAQIIFTLPDSESYVSGLLEVFLDGLLQTKDVDYTETTSQTFTMTIAPDANETLRINYVKQ